MDDPWRRIEAEKPQRDAARRAWDAEHDPSPEFEYAIRPLGEDYGRDRPRYRELTPEQRVELEEVFGRSWEELQALRERDPRAGHNRDGQGRILGPDGLPRVERSPEEVLREAERQRLLYGPGAARDADDGAEATDTGDTADDAGAVDDAAGSSDPMGGDERGIEPQAADVPTVKAPSDHLDVQHAGDADDDASGEDEGTGENEPGHQAEELSRVIAELRSGGLTPQAAADRLDHLRTAAPPSGAESSDQREPPAEEGAESVPESETRGTVPHDEPTTEVIESKDGLTYERPERRESPNIFEARPGDQGGFKELKRVAGTGGHDFLDGMKEMGNNLDAALEEVVVAEPRPSWEGPQYGHHEGGAGDAFASVALVLFAVATGVHAAKERWDNRKSDAG